MYNSATVYNIFVDLHEHEHLINSQLTTNIRFINCLKKLKAFECAVCLFPPNKKKQQNKTTKTNQNSFNYAGEDNQPVEVTYSSRRIQLWEGIMFPLVLSTLISFNSPSPSKKSTLLVQE